MTKNISDAEEGQYHIDQANRRTAIFKAAQATGISIRSGEKYFGNFKAGALLDAITAHVPDTTLEEVIACLLQDARAYKAKAEGLERQLQEKKEEAR